MSYLSKFSSNKKSKVSSASSFWADEWSSYDDEMFTESYYDAETDSFQTKKLSSSQSSTVEMLRLSAHRRAIGNFVNILTNKNIPVKFYKKGDSYTDGKSVVLSAEVKPEKFDVAVGLALHEASHINLTNFSTFGSYSVPQSLREIFESKNVYNGEVWNLIKNLTNWIEDRRIDQYIFNTCPGYRDYYRALYDEYFNDKVIDKGIVSDEFTDETIDSYMFRVINLTNPNTVLSKLKGLAKIYSLVELKNISRLLSTYDSLIVAEQIAEIIGLAIDPLPQSQPKPQDGGEGEQDKDGEPQQTDGNGGQGDSDVNEDVDNDASNDEQSPSTGGGSMKNQPNMNGSESDGDSNSEADGDKDDANGKSKQTLANNVKKQLDKKIQNQKDFINNQIKKKGISKKDEQLLDSVEKSGTEMVSVGGEIQSNGTFLKGTQCIVSKRMTEGLMQDRDFPFADWYKGWNDTEGKFHGYNESTLRKGIQLGTLLGKRLAIRSEERVTDNPRQKSGKIDRRLIAGLGYDYVNVFSTKDVDKFKKANLHISLDGSGSMAGGTWDKALTTTIAICKAASMVSNLNVQVTIRGIWGTKAYICQAYDSRVDKFDKVKRLFPALHANGTTPEGLAFEGVMKQMVGSTSDVDSYFLNISDGEPYFHGRGYSYQGYYASKHTKKMVDKIQSMGIKVLSYFVSEYSGDVDATSGSGKVFKDCYGKAAHYINVTNVNEVVRTMNKLFMNKPAGIE